MKAKNVIDHYAPQHEEMADYQRFVNEGNMTKGAELARNPAKTLSNRNCRERNGRREWRLTWP
jgi:hypothetical protein